MGAAAAGEAKAETETFQIKKIFCLGSLVSCPGVFSCM